MLKMSDTLPRTVFCVKHAVLVWRNHVDVEEVAGALQASLSIAGVLMNRAPRPHPRIVECFALAPPPGSRQIELLAKCPEWQHAHPVGDGVAFAEVHLVEVVDPRSLPKVVDCRARDPLATERFQSGALGCVRNMRFTRNYS